MGIARFSVTRPVAVIMRIAALVLLGAICLTKLSVDLLPKIKIELVVTDDQKEKALQAIIGAARTGRIGDGKIFVSRIEEAIRIRNDERGETAL